MVILRPLRLWSEGLWKEWCLSCPEGMAPDICPGLARELEGPFHGGASAAKMKKIGFEVKQKPAGYGKGAKRKTG